MKVNPNLTGFEISAKGLSVQRKKMNLIAENIANADSIRTDDGQPYQRKVLEVTAKQQFNAAGSPQPGIRMAASKAGHISNPYLPGMQASSSQNLNFKEVVDPKEGEHFFMPDHPDADEEGYVKMSNVNIINEMVEMIAASRSYEANLTAFNSSKQMAKDSLEIGK